MIATGRDDAATLGVADWLCLAASPTFAIMALLVGLGGAPDMLCASAEAPASPLGGMVAMYLLMSAFHSVPWLRLFRRRSGKGAAGGRRRPWHCMGTSGAGMTAHRSSGGDEA